MAVYRIELNGEESEIQVERNGDRLKITRDGTTTTVRLVYDDGIAFTLERELPQGGFQNIRAAGLVNGNDRQIWVNGRTFSYRRIQRSGGAAAGDYANTLSTSIPAVVSELLVKVGETVTVGEKLILLESMKMVIPIQAPCSGTVTAINCTVGEAVQPGIQLIEIAETGERVIR